MEFKIKSLLDKFFEGSSTLQEEQQLKSFYLKNEFPEDSKVYLPLFQYFDAEKAIEIQSPSFRQNVIEIIISGLIEKYFEGTSSLDEEQILKTYFSGDNVSEKFNSYKSIFDFTENATGLSLGSGFDTKLEVELIKSTIEKYFEGESSLQDEKDLKTYFSKPDVAEELKMYSGIFRYFEVDKENALSIGFNSKLHKKLKVVSDQPKIRSLIPRMVRVAAAVLLAAGLFWIVNSGSSGDKIIAQSETIDWSKYEAKDPEEAYRKTMAALAMVSNKMEEGKEQTLKGFSKIKTANEAVGL